MSDKKFYEPESVLQKSVLIRVPYNQITNNKETIDTINITAIIRNNGSVSIYNDTGSNIFDFRSIRVEKLNALIIALTELSRHKSLHEEKRA